MKRILAGLLVLGLCFSLTSCKTTSGAFAAAGPYVACAHAGIDADGKNLPDVAALGVVQVHVGDCSGEKVVFNGSVEVTLYYTNGQDVLDCGTSYGFGSTSDTYSALVKEVDHGFCPFFENSSRWKAVIAPCAWMLGDRYCASGISTDWEYRVGA